jgi:hypothetical protein
MEDLVQFVKDLSPCLSKVCQDVDGRRKDLLNPYQRDQLGQHLEQVKIFEFARDISYFLKTLYLGERGISGPEEVTR